MKLSQVNSKIQGKNLLPHSGQVKVALGVPSGASTCLALTGACILECKRKLLWEQNSVPQMVQINDFWLESMSPSCTFIWSCKALGVAKL